MDGWNLLDYVIFNENDIHKARSQMKHRVLLHPIFHASQNREDIADLTFNATMNIINDHLKENGFIITKKGGEKDG